MKFGPVPLAEAEGAVLAHSLAAGGHTIRKGTRVGAAERAAFEAAGLDQVVVARLESGDLTEDEAAARLAHGLAGSGVAVERAFTGRVNLYAERPGVLVVDAAAIDRLNAVDEAVTFATLPAFARVEAGRMIGTVKIIPFAVPERVVEDASGQAGGPVLQVAPFVIQRVGLVQTRVEGTPEKVLDKTRRVTAERLAVMGADLIGETRTSHAAQAVAEALRAQAAQGAELLLVFGASAIADRQDVIPEAIEAAGGRVIHFGMPVDPGNLLLMGEMDGRPVLGAPGCARSPKENGFDWVLARLMAGLPVTRTDITRMGVGGLLMEIASRPQPREDTAPAPRRPKVVGLLLAAGRSTRMGGPNKLLEPIHGVPVVRRSAEALRTAGITDITLVTGHMAADVAAAVGDRAARSVHNPDFAEGLSTSLRAGIAALPEDADGVLVALGDMPGISPEMIRALLAAFDPGAGRAIVLPTVDGRRGNPVLWARRFWEDLKRVQGDVGARHLLGTYGDAVAEVPVSGPGALLDVDTPEALEAARRVLPG